MVKSFPNVRFLIWPRHGRRLPFVSDSTTTKPTQTKANNNDDDNNNNNNNNRHQQTDPLSLLQNSLRVL